MKMEKDTSADDHHLNWSRSSRREAGRQQEGGVNYMRVLE